jgi:hypothetical protein
MTTTSVSSNDQVILPSVTHVAQSSRTGIERRQLAVVHGVCMYQSTGNNSGLSGTWFPFLGLNHKGHPYYMPMHGEGYFYKPAMALPVSHEPEDGYSPEVNAKMREVFQDQTKNIAARFGSLYNMMVSSQFGGGLWDTPEGATFKNWLEKSYSNFYQNFPKLQAGSGTEMTDGIAVNKWMIRQGGDLKKLPLETKLFTSPLKASDIIGKPKMGAGEYVISWLKFVPELAKKVINELPAVKLPSFSLPSIKLPSFTKQTTKPLPDNIAKLVFSEIESKHRNWAMYGTERRELLEPAMEKLIKLSKNKKIDEPTRKQEVINILSEISSNSNSKKYNSTSGAEQALRIANDACMKHFGHNAEAKQGSRKSVILNPKMSTGGKMTTDKENKVPPDDNNATRKKRQGGPN